MPTDYRPFITAYANAWSHHDPEAVCSYFAEHFSFEDIPMGLSAGNRTELIALLEDTFRQVPDFRMEVTKVFNGDGFAAYEWIQSGTASGHLEGKSVNQQPYRVHTTSIVGFVNNRIIRVVDNWDSGVFYKRHQSS